MKKALYCCLFCLVLAACAGGSYNKAENAFDAGREFIDSYLKGDFDKARFYMLHNTTNDQDLDKLEAEYDRKNANDKREYHDASITVLEEETISDSIHIINYKNSFDQIARKIKVVNTPDGWLVDLHYTFDGNL